MDELGELTKKMVSAVEQRDADAFAELFAEDVVGHHPLAPEPVRGREEMKAHEAALYEAFSDIEVEVRSEIGQGRTCALEVVLRAVNTGPIELGPDEEVPATGRSIEVPAVWVYAVGDDGLIEEARDYFDTATLMSQLGFIGDE